MKRVLLVLVCLLAAPAGAEGRPFNASEMRMVELAHDHWGKGPACARITYEVTTRAAIGGSGDAWPCNIRIANDMPWVEACTTVAHEWGHLLHGPEHFGVMGDLMSESPNTTDGCSRADDRRYFTALKKRCARKPSAKRARCVRRARATVFG